MRRSFLYKYLILVLLVLVGIFNKNTKTTGYMKKVVINTNVQYSNKPLLVVKK